MTRPPRPPTSVECDAKARVVFDGVTYMAYWYPQMGGYTCHSWTRIAPEVEGCFEAYVWHDGSFPFDDDREPGCVHHCSPRQFIDYGEDVLAAQRELVERGSDG